MQQEFPADLEQSHIAHCYPPATVSQLEAEPCISPEVWHWGAGTDGVTLAESVPLWYVEPYVDTQIQSDDDFPWLMRCGPRGWATYVRVGECYRQFDFDGVLEEEGTRDGSPVSECAW